MMAARAGRQNVVQEAPGEPLEAAAGDAEPLGPGDVDEALEGVLGPRTAEDEPGEELGAPLDEPAPLRMEAVVGALHGDTVWTAIAHASATGRCNCRYLIRRLAPVFGRTVDEAWREHAEV